MRLILDVGSGASIPDVATARRIVEAIASVDKQRHEVIIKAQLFKHAPPNTPLDLGVFDALYGYAQSLGYPCTASVFDMDSLQYLLSMTVPFVKFACIPGIYWLAGKVPREVPTYASKTVGTLVYNQYMTKVLDCVRKYPAVAEDYAASTLVNVSDHTVGWGLLRSSMSSDSNPKIWEKHFRLDDATGPDAGPWAVTAEEMKEITG